MNLKVLRSDNQTLLRIQLGVTYKELSTVKSLVDVDVWDEEHKVKLFSVMPSNTTVSISTKGLALPFGNSDKEINITAQLEEADDLKLRYFVALVKQGLDAFLKNFHEAKENIEKLAEGVEIE